MRVELGEIREAIAYDLRAEGLTYQEIGEVLRVSAQRASQLVARQEQRVRRAPQELDFLLTRTRNACAAAGIRTIADLRQAVETGALAPGAVPGYGIVSHRIVVGVLAKSDEEIAALSTIQSSLSATAVRNAAAKQAEKTASQLAALRLEVSRLRSRILEARELLLGVD